MNAMLVKGVTKQFHGSPVLNDVSFELEKGECLGLMGESGKRKEYPRPLYHGNAAGGQGGDPLDGGTHRSFI
ncbi:hypothetical protein ACPJHQ_22615 [Rossellomorea sp. H39__3]